MADKYAARLKEKNALVQGIKADIKEVLAEKGYGNGVYANLIGHLNRIGLQGWV